MWQAHAYTSVVLTQHTPLWPFCHQECEAHFPVRGIELIL